MNSDAPNEKMQTTGIVLLWLALPAFVGMCVFLGSFVLSIITSGTRAYAPLASFFNGITPYVTIITLAAEALAVLLLAAGIACWRSRVFRSRRWVVSALGVGFVAAVILLFLFIAVVIGIPNV